jgi:hypothetical protein
VTDLVQRALQRRRDNDDERERQSRAKRQLEIDKLVRVCAAKVQAVLELSDVDPTIFTWSATPDTPTAHPAYVTGAFELDGLRFQVTARSFNHTAELRVLNKAGGSNACEGLYGLASLIESGTVVPRVPDPVTTHEAWGQS